MAAQGDYRPRTVREWRIVPRTINQHGDVVFDVFHGDERRAWGLKDEATAHRWLSRLSPPAAAKSVVGPPTLLEPERSGDSEEQSAEDSPRRVWWNEA